MFPPEELIFHAAAATVLDLSEGDFAKNILILVLSEPNNANNRIFLSKVLLAAKLDLTTDTRFAEISVGQQVNCFSGLPEPPKHILVFGLPPAQVGYYAASQLYQPINLHHCTWLFADALSVLEHDRNKKGQLWEAIKTMFL